MSAVIVLAGSKLIADAVATGLAKLGVGAQAYDQATDALDAVRQAKGGVLLLHPRSGGRIDLSPMQRLAEVGVPARCILLVDPRIVVVADGTVNLPPHSRVSLNAELDQLVACILEGRAKVWRSTKRGPKGSPARKRRVSLPDGVSLTPTQAEVLRDHCQGFSAVEIAQKRGSSVRTIETHMRTIRRLTGIGNNLLLAVQYATWTAGSDLAIG